MNKKTSIVTYLVALVMVIATIAIAARAEPKIFSYNFTTAITRGELINTTFCGSNGTNTSGPSFYVPGQVNILSGDKGAFNLTYNASFSTVDPQSFLVIRDIETSCQTDNLLSTLVNTTQAAVNGSVLVYQSQQQMFSYINGSNQYITQLGDCRELVGQTSVKQVHAELDLNTCKTDETNLTAELAIAKTSLESRTVDLSSCQTNQQNTVSQLQKCNTDLQGKGSLGGYLMAGLAGAAICYYMTKKKDGPEQEMAQFRQA